MKVYFGNKRTIERMDFHGGSREVLVSEGLDAPEGLAIDWVHRRMYWTDTRCERYTRHEAVMFLLRFFKVTEQLLQHKSIIF